MSIHICHNNYYHLTFFFFFLLLLLLSLFFPFHFFNNDYTLQSQKSVFFFFSLVLLLLMYTFMHDFSFISPLTQWIWVINHNLHLFFFSLFSFENKSFDIKIQNYVIFEKKHFPQVETSCNLLNLLPIDRDFFMRKIVLMFADTVFTV